MIRNEMAIMPLVSIIIPTYNQQDEFLRECIESAIAQTYDNIEIVISDNFSTNNSPKIIKEYASKDNRIRIVRPSHFLTIAESFLFVFTQALGKYSCYISSDDILMPDCVEKLTENLEHNPGAVFAHGKALYFDSDNINSINWDYFYNVAGTYNLSGYPAEKLFNFEYVCFGGCMVRNSIWPAITARLKETDIKITYSVDMLLVSLLFEQGNVYFHNDLLAKIRMENDTRVSRLPALIEDAISIWYFWLNNLKFSLIIQDKLINLNKFKKSYFNKLFKTMLYYYVNDSFSLIEFKTAVEDLKILNPKPKRLYSMLIWMVLNYPDLSIRLYKMINGN